MKEIFFCSLLMMNSVLMMNLMNPVSLVILIILSSLYVCVLVKLMISSSWFSYILFMVFLGGLMVLFTYVCSVASNEQISVKGGTMTVAAATLLAVMTSLLYSDELMRANNTSNSLHQMFSSSSTYTLLTTMVYLLMSLFVCVSIAQLKFGPMRAKKMN